MILEKKIKKVKNRLTPKHLFLVIDYMEKGELFDYIVNKKRMD